MDDILEAMSYGLPVVVPDVGGFPEIIHNGEQGFLIEGRNKETYVERILELVHNRNLRLRLARSARERVVDCFSREAMVQNYHKFYQEILSCK